MVDSTTHKLGRYVGPSMNHWNFGTQTPWSMPSGGYKLLPSYFAPDLSAKGLGLAYGGAEGTICNALLVKWDGIATATKRGTIAVPAEQTIVQKRNVAPNSTYEVQVFAAKQAKVTAVWYTLRKSPGGLFYRVPRLTTRYTVKAGANRLTFKAPSKRGAYAGLALSFGGPDVTGFNNQSTIGVGLKTNPRPGSTR